MDLDFLSDPEEEDNSDWLKDLSPEGEDAGDDPFGGSEEDAPDWLSDIREAESTSDGPSEKAEDNQDWLDNIRSQEAENAEAPTPDTGDYLDRVQALQSEEENQEQEPAQDWLSGLGDDESGAGAIDIGAEAESQGADKPEWLSDLSKEESDPEGFVFQPNEGAAADAFSFQPDEDAGAGADAGAFAFQPDEGAAPGADVGAFSFQPDQDASLGADAGAFSFQPDEGASPGADAGAFAFQPDEGASPGADAGAFAFQPDEGASPDAFSFQPDQDASPGADAGAFSFPADESGDMEADAGVDISAFNPEPDSDEKPTSGSLLDMLGAASKEEGGAFAPDIVDQTPADSGDPPEWLNSIRDSAQTVDPESQVSAFGADMGSVSSQASEVDAEFPDLPGDPGEGGAALPAWLGDLQDSAPDLGEVGDLPALIENIPEEPLASETEDPALQIEPADLPDWLSESGAQALIEEDETAPSPSAPPDDIGEIAKADLPSWLQAMRPTGTPIEIETGQPAEPGEEVTIGPLTGLSDVLPAEPEVVNFGESHSLSVGEFTLSPVQLNHISMLEDMIASEDEAPPVSRRKLSIPQQVMRWIIAGLLYVIVFIPVLIDTPILDLPDPENRPEEVTAAINLINNLAPGAQVLAAFEYRPGLSGELEAAAVSLFDNLISRGANLVLISTQPTGPGLAENFLQKTQSHHLYVTNKFYKNLGYISGGSAALLNFAANPRLAVPLQYSDGSSQWDQPPLTGIQNIRNFALILVITDDPDNARGWIEQVQPELINPLNPALNVPLLMIVSAQAEPLVRPYYEVIPRQVSGFISGIKGAAFYESGQNEKLARKYWDSYKIGMGLTVFIIVIGGVYNFSLATLSARKEKKEKR